ncbi:MAG: hypothetical protein GY699_15980 [Desulfobacteraceae bacterium]|nr:hypothetical protein [Desulfobacteraceae bacterium]
MNLKDYQFLTIISVVVLIHLPKVYAQTNQDTLPTIQSKCSSIAEVTKRDAASTFILSYEDVHKYFGEKLDPMSVAQNPTDRPWWILRTKKRIYWHGRKPATKNGALIGGSWGNAIEATGHIFMAIRGGELQFALAHEQDLARTLGKGSEVHFNKTVWTPICGNKYRNGGFSITANGLEYTLGTEQLDWGRTKLTI